MESKGKRAPRVIGPTQRPTVPPAAAEPFGEAVARQATPPAEIPGEETTAPVAPTLERGAVPPVDTEAEASAPAAALPPETASPVETAPEPPVPVGAVGAVEPATEAVPDYFGRGAFDALAESQAAVARGLEALSAEVAGLTISGIDAVARTATQMLSVKTLSDAFAVNAGFARNSFDSMVSGSTKLSELGVKLATDASQPILAQLGKGWVKATRAGP